MAGAGEGDAGARKPSCCVSRWGTAPPDFRDPEEGVTSLPPGSHHEQHAAVPAPVQEPWALSSAWLPGYKIICQQLPRRGLGWETRAGELEIVSAVGNAVSTFDHI